jgi:hypothetical protein
MAGPGYMLNPDELDSNSKKLDHIVHLLEGSKDAPGLLHKVEQIRAELYGNGTMGLIQKVTIMWRAHVWILCGLSGVVGSFVTAMVKWIVK